MSEISKINIGGVDYPLRDSQLVGNTLIEAASVFNGVRSFKRDSSGDLYFQFSKSGNTSDSYLIYFRISQKKIQVYQWDTSVANWDLKYEVDSDGDITKSITTPEAFGAAGDGVTDDSAAINAALAAGKNVEFDGSKTYKCDSYINIPNGSNLYGNGATIIFDPNATLNSDDSNMTIRSAEDITIDGFKFDFSNTTNLHNALTIVGSKRVRVNNCDFANNYGYVTRLHDNRDVIFSGCSFRNITGGSGNPGGALYGVRWKDYVIENCSCDAIDDHFIYIVDGDNIKIVNCTIKKAGNSSVMPGAAIQLYGGTKNVIVDNCTDIDCGSHGFDLREYAGTAVQSSVPTNIIVSNHHSKNCSKKWFYCYGNGVHEAENITIKNCLIEDCTDDAINILECTNLIVSENIIKNVKTANSSPITMAYVTNGIVSNNIIDSASEYGIMVGYGEGSCVGIAVEGNIINKITTAGIYPRRVTDRVQISNNMMLNSTPLVTANQNTPSALLTGEAITQADKHSITFGDNTTAVLHYAGDIIFNKSPASGQPMGWICTATGAPGTLVAMPNL